MADSVNREGLDYRAGWIEALSAFRVRIRLHSIRCKKNQLAGLDPALEIARSFSQEAIGTVQGTPAAAPAAPEKGRPSGRLERS